MKTKPTYTILEDAARDHIPDNVDVRERILTQIRKDKSLMNTRWKLAWITITLFILAVGALSLPGTASSMKKLLGYIPGIGVVDQSTPIRHNTEPVALTRDGVTVTIDKVILDTVWTTVKFHIEGIPSSAYPQHHAGSDQQGFQKPCDDTLYLRLPDGTLVERDGYNAISGHVEVTAYEASFTLAPVPAEFDQATLVMPCILGVEQGLAPENWEFELQFEPGDEEMIIPVHELQTAAAEPGTTSISTETATNPGSLPSLGISFILDKWVPLPDGDVLYGRMEWDENTLYSAVTPDTYVLTDSLGQQLQIEQVSPDPASMPVPGSRYVPVAFKVMSPVENPGPLTLTITSVSANLYDKSTQFTFDTGLNPEVGQEWTLDKEIRFGEFSFQIRSAVRASDGYDFYFQPSDGLQCADIVLPGSTLVGGGCWPDHTSVKFDVNPPSGVLNVWVSNLAIQLNGSWQVTWEPQK